MPQDSEHRGRPRSRSASPGRPDDARRRNDHARQEKRSRSASRQLGADGRREGGRRRSKSKSGSRSRSVSRSRRKDIHRRRSRSRSREGGRSHSRERRKDRDHPERRERRKRSMSSTSSRSDDAGEKKRSKKKRRGSRERRKEKKREKKERKERKKASVSTPQWGKYGIITEVDIYSKASEFHTWLVEERKINPETISKEQSKKEFVRFVEDFNTDINEATLPHEKYYNMEAHERRMSALRQGEFLPPPEDTYDPRADMKAIIGAHKRKAVEQDSYLNKEQLMELRQVLHDRTAAAKMKLIGMEVGQNMGVRMDGTMFDE